MENGTLYTQAPEIQSEYDPDAQIVLYRGDVAELTGRLPRGSIDLVLTSPPYNLGKNYDPYAGVGSSIIAALAHGRRAIASERDPVYADLAVERVEAYFRGQLKLRPLGRPVYEPTGKEKVSQRPAEWQPVQQSSLIEPRSLCASPKSIPISTVTSIFWCISRRSGAN